MAEESLFGGLSPEQAQLLVSQQQGQQGMNWGSTMGPQGNPFYIPGAAAGMYTGGARLGTALGGAMGAVPPQVAEAYKIQNVMQETEKAGIDFDTDPVGYMKVASSNFLKAGMHDKALQVMNQANAMKDQESDREYKGAMGRQADAVATEKTELLDEKQADMEARTTLTNAKTVKERAEAEIMQLEEARKAAREPRELELIDARIFALRETATAAGNAALKAGTRMSRESVNQMFARMVQERLARGEITEGEAFELVKAGAVDPIRLLMGSMGLGSAGGPVPMTPPVRGKEPPAPVATPTQATEMVPVANPQPAVPGGGPYKPQPGYDFKKAATNAWGKFEPNKYDYRVNPETGKIQRKAK